MDIIKTSDATKIIQMGTEFVNVLDLVINKLGAIKTLALGFGAFTLFKNRSSFDTMGKATLNTFKALLNVFRKLKGLDPLEFQKIKNNPNDKINNLLNKQKEALTKGVETGEAYADGIAEGIESNTSIQEAIDSKLGNTDELLPNNTEQVNEEPNNTNEIVTNEEESVSAIKEVDEEVKTLDSDISEEKILNVDTTESREELNLVKENLDEINNEIEDKELNINASETEENLNQVQEKLENIETEADKKTEFIVNTAEAEEGLNETSEKIENVESKLDKTSVLSIEDVEAINQLTELDEKIEEIQTDAQKPTEIDIDTTEAETKIAGLESSINTAKSEASEINVSSGVKGEVTKVAEEGVESGVESTVVDGLLGVAGMTAEGVIGTATAGVGIFAIPLIIEGISKLMNANKELEASNQKVYNDAQQSASNYQSQIQQLTNFENSENGKKLESLNAQYQAGQLNTSQTQNYFDLLKQIAQIAPETVAFKDDNGNPYINMTNGVKGLIDDLKQLKQQENETLVTPKNVDNF